MTEAVPTGSGGGRLSSTQLLQLTTFTSTIDRFAMPPLLIAIAHDLDVPLTQVVHAAGAYFLAYGLMQPVWGLVSDSVGVVRTMRLALMLAGISTTISAVVWTPWALIVARAVAGGLFGAAYPSSLIYVGDTVPMQRRQREVTELMVGTAAGTAVASLAAGLVGHLLSWRLAFAMTGVCAVALAFLLRQLVEPPRTRGHRHVLSPIGHVLRSRAAVLVLLLAFLEGVVLLGVLTLLPPAVEAAGATAATAGAVAATYGVAVFLAARAVGRVSLSQHPSILIALGAMAALAACAVLAASRSPWAAIVVASLLGLAWAAMHSTLQTWATEVIPGARATMVSLFAGSLFVGSAVAALLVSGLVEAERYQTIFVLAAIVVVPLGVLATCGRARWQNPDDEQR